MGTVVSYFEHKRRAGGARVRQIDPVMVEIFDALMVLGGGAHRQAVADQIAFRRTGRSRPADASARNEIYGAFDAYIARAGTRKAPPLICQPLGSSSYRWALTNTGRELFSSPPLAPRMVR